MTADHFQPKAWIFLYGPGFMAGLLGLTWLLPWLSPRRFAIDPFWSTYHRVMMMLFTFFAYLYAVMLWSAMGSGLDAGRAIFCGACVLIALIGNLMGKLRRNFYIGIRTPWTLASERVWNDTHRFAARIMVFGGLGGAVLAYLRLYGWAVAALIAPALIGVAYSLIHYKSLERRGELDEAPVAGEESRSRA
jgi:uncharacterized membrane protein